MPEVIISMDLHIKPEMLEGFCTSIPEMIKDTAKRPGFVGIHIVQHKDDTTRVLFVERWETEQAYHDYIAWRTERGDMDNFGQQLAAAPKLEVWPTIVAMG
jgi:quinol monooxygenase YgiN